MENQTILYVEDNFFNREIIRRTLEAQGCKVVEAEDGITGLEKIRAIKPNIVLLDISLPGMDGLEVLAHLKGDVELRDIPVIAVTASAMSGDRERFLEAGCDDYLSKPVHLPKLIEMVRKHAKVDQTTLPEIHNLDKAWEHL